MRNLALALAALALLACNNKKLNPSATEPVEEAAAPEPEEEPPPSKGKAAYMGKKGGALAPSEARAPSKGGGILAMLSAKPVDQGPPEDPQARLEWAIEHQGLAEVMDALELGADPKATYSGGRTALHIAAGNRKLDIVEHLLGLEVAVNAKTEDGLTPLDYAHRTPFEAAIADEDLPGKENQAAVIELLEKHGGQKGKSAK